MSRAAMHAWVARAFLGFLFTVLLGGGVRTVYAEDARDSNEVKLEGGGGQTGTGGAGSGEAGAKLAEATATDPCGQKAQDDASKVAATCAQFEPACPQVCAKTGASGYCHAEYMGFAEQKVRLYYFTNVVELMYMLNPGALELKYPGAAQTTMEVEADLLAKECTYNLALKKETDAKNKLQTAEREAADAERSSTTAVANRKTAEQNPAVADASNTQHDAAVKALEACKTAEGAASTKKDAAQKTLGQAQTDLQNAQASLETARVVIEVERELATTRFGLARDHGPLYVAYGNTSFEDPLLRVTLIGLPDNMQVIVRGRQEDVRKVVAIIKEVDAPAPQARLTLWTLELNSDTSPGSNERMNQALMEVEEEFAGCREEISAVLSILKDTITEEVITATSGKIPLMEPNYPLERFLFYDFNVLRRLGYDIEEVLPFDTLMMLGLQLKSDSLRQGDYAEWIKYCCDSSNVSATTNERNSVSHKSDPMMDELTGGNAWKNFVFTRYIIPDPLNIATLGDALIVLQLAQKKYQIEIVDKFEKRLTQQLNELCQNTNKLECYKMNRLRRLLNVYDYSDCMQAQFNGNSNRTDSNKNLNGNQQLLIAALQRSALERFLPASSLMEYEIELQTYALVYNLSKCWNDPLIHKIMMEQNETSLFNDVSSQCITAPTTDHEWEVLCNSVFTSDDADQASQKVYAALTSSSSSSSRIASTVIEHCTTNIIQYYKKHYNEYKNNQISQNAVSYIVHKTSYVLQTYYLYKAYGNNHNNLGSWLFHEFDMSWASQNGQIAGISSRQQKFYVPEEIEPQIAQADELLKQMNQAMEDEIDEYFVRPMLDRLRKKMLKLKLGVGVIQRTGILATNRMVARVDPRASAQLEMVTEEDYLEGFKQLLSVLEEVQDQDMYTSQNLQLAQQLVDFHNTDRTEIYGITSGNLFKVTPVFDPSGEALRFKLDYNYSTRITDPGGASGGPHASLPRIEKHDVNTEVQLSNLEIREVSRFESNVSIGIPPSRSGGIPFIKEDPLFKDIPFIGYFTRRQGRSAVVQQNLIFAQTTIYPSITDIVRAMTTPIPDIAYLLEQTANENQASDSGQAREGAAATQTGYICAWKASAQGAVPTGTVLYPNVQLDGFDKLPFFYHGCQPALQKKLDSFDQLKKPNAVPVIIVTFTLHELQSDPQGACQKGVTYGYAENLELVGVMDIPIPEQKKPAEVKPGQAASQTAASFRQLSYDYDTSTSLEMLLIEQGLLQQAAAKEGEAAQDGGAKAGAAATEPGQAGASGDQPKKEGRDDKG
jgi:hypothetical protein